MILIFYSYEVIKCPNDLLSIKICDKNRKIHLHSIYDPICESSLFVQSLALQKEKIAIIFGAGFFYNIFEILNTYKNLEKIIVLEPDENILNLFYSNFGNDLDPKIKVFIMKNKNLLDFSNYLNNCLTWTNVDFSTFVLSPGYKLLYKESFDLALETIYQVFSNKKIYQNTLLHNADIWATNSLCNIKYIIDSYYYGHLINKFKGLPVILVSAGPSLNQDIDILKKVTKKAVIMCVYTAYQVLKNNDIVPDFIISIEGNQLIHETEIQKNEKIDIPILYCINVQTDFIRKFTSQKIFFTNHFDLMFPNFFQKLNIQLPIVSSGGSVSSSALSICVQFGFETIILLGYDLGYTYSKSHAKGTFYDNIKENIDQTKMFLIDSNDGTKIFTDNMFEHYRRWSEDFICLYNDNHNFINTTQKGAFIKGTSVMSFDDASKKYLNKDISTIKKNIFDNFYKYGIFFNKIQKIEFEKFLSDESSKIPKIKKLLQENLNISKKLLLHYKKINILDKNILLLFLKTLRKNDAQIETYNLDESLFNFYFSKHIHKSVKLDTQFLEEGLMVSKKSILFYKGLLKSISKLQNYLNFIF